MRKLLQFTLVYLVYYSLLVMGLALHVLLTPKLPLQVQLVTKHFLRKMQK